MTDFRNNHELRKMDFEIKMYRLDSDINSILNDAETCKDKEIIKNHIMRIDGMLEEYQELRLCGIDVIAIDVEFLRYVNRLLVDKYCDLL